MRKNSNDGSLEYVYNIRNKMRIHNFMLAYRGSFSQEITKALLASTEKKLMLEGAEAALQKKVFYVMVECLQNICKHNDTETNPAIFMVGGTGSDYIIYSGNIILTEKIDTLRNKLIAINSMSKDELKELSKSLITASELSDSGGAGLGLIDIAKKSGSILEFSFEEIDNTFAFFSLRTTVSGKKEINSSETLSTKETQNLSLSENQGNTISYIREFHDLMNKNNLVMIYEGTFNQDITKIVLALTEKKFDAEGMDVALRKKIFNVMVESLQNICKHQFPDDKEHLSHAVFMIGNNKQKETTIISGNVLNEDVIPVIQSRLDQINALDKDGLKQLYKEARIKATISEVGGAGLGFIDMARKSGNKLLYHFNEMDNKRHFFTLLSTVAQKESEN